MCPACYKVHSHTWHSWSHKFLDHRVYKKKKEAFKIGDPKLGNTIANHTKECKKSAKDLKAFGYTKQLDGATSKTP